MAATACNLSGDTLSEKPDGALGGLELVRYVAHGEWIGDGRQRIEPSLSAVRDTQAHLIAELQTVPGSGGVDQDFILETIRDPPLADAFYIDQLLMWLTRPARRALGK